MRSNGLARFAVTTASASQPEASEYAPYADGKMIRFRSDIRGCAAARTLEAFSTTSRIGLRGAIQTAFHAIPIGVHWSRMRQHFYWGGWCRGLHSGLLCRQRTLLLAPKKECRTSRVMTTTTSRSVTMLSRNYNTNPMMDVHRRW